MLNLIENFKEKARKLNKTIVLPEGEEPRVIRAAEKITAEGFAKIIILGDEKVIREKCPDAKLDGVKIVRDDGAQTWEDTQKMILRAVDEGITDIVCTSHATPGITPFPTEKYLAHFAQAQQWCRENQLPVTLHTGCEILYTDASPHLLKEGHYPSLAETWTVLVEFSGDVPYSRMCEAARLFGNAGFTVIFAHVERFDPMRNFKHVRELREEYGVYMQMNANTVLMKKGFFADRWTRKMLDEGYIDCIATDAHNTTSRPCRMRECFEKLKASYGVEAAEELCGGFQRRLLNL